MVENTGYIINALNGAVKAPTGLFVYITSVRPLPDRGFFVAGDNMNRLEIYSKLDTPEAIASLLALEDFSPVYREADRVRKEHVGDTVHLRAIIEFSNICKRQCIYCGLNRDNKELPRFRMSRDEIIETAAKAVKAGYRTIVLQSGEEDGIEKEWLGKVITDIKSMTVPGTSDVPAVTVSCGEKDEETYRYLYEKGADRYLLKHETADPELYDRLHPCGTLESRVECLRTLKRLGYETGSGFMVGLPGQSLETLGRDLLLLTEIPCRMAGIGPFISNPKTPLAGNPNGDPELTRRAVAIARLLLPDANLPLTTALSILSKEETEKGCITENPFEFGANVIMKKVTPDEYKAAYEIYPAQFNKTDILQDRKDLERMIMAYGRQPL